MAMPGVVYFSDSNQNIEGDLLGTLVFDDTGDPTKLSDIIPLSGTSDGVWIEVKKYDKICLGLICDAAATFKVCGSMAIAQPANTVHGYQLFSDKVYTGAYQEILALKTPLRWIKVRVTANSGNVSAPLIGV
jgi:hypothetical protein